MRRSSTSTATIQKVPDSVTIVGLRMLTGCRPDVQRAMDVAFKYRNYFRKDIIVDLIAYRRW